MVEVVVESFALQNPMKFGFGWVYLGDAYEVLKGLGGGEVGMVFTSPPYCMRRGWDYGGVDEGGYVEWFSGIADEVYRVLSPSGSFFINIREHVVDGERATYVLELILELRRRGWYWVEEYIWRKKTPMPGRFKYRFKNGWERVLHFTKGFDFTFNRDAVRVAIKPASKLRALRSSRSSNPVRASKTGSRMVIDDRNIAQRDWAYPDNVIECPNSNFRSHSAAFPVELPAWFIKVFSNPNDIILDPFFGSGTTAIAAYRLGRRFMGIEILPKYFEVACKRIYEECEQGVLWAHETEAVGQGAGR